jgi:hypothetical protein
MRVVEVVVRSWPLPVLLLVAVAAAPSGFDTTSPAPLEVQSEADTGDGRLASGEGVLVPFTQLAVLFTEPMRDPEGSTAPDDLTNPDNWLLVAAGADGELDTPSCAAGPDPSDVVVALDGVLAWPEQNGAVVDLEGLRPLLRTRYRLFACATLVDLAGNPLDGNGDGLAGDDMVIDFVQIADESLVNPNVDGGLDSWTGG